MNAIVFMLQSSGIAKRSLLFILVVALTAPMRAEDGKEKPHLWQDVALVSAATCVYILVIPDTRRRLFHEASLSRVWRNFRDPIGSAIEGGRLDHNGFWINYVGHPLSFAALGLYLKDRGYSNGNALLFSQVVNVVWEYVIEGSMWLPSGKDLLTDLCGSLAAIYILDPLSDSGERKIARGDRRWGNYFLYYLNPFKKINRWIFGRKQGGAAFYAFPARKGFVAGVQWLK